MKNDYSKLSYRLEKYFEQVKNSRFDVATKALKRNMDGLMLSLSDISTKTAIPIEIVRTDAVDLLAMTEDKFFSLYDAGESKYIERNDDSYERLNRGELDEAIIVLKVGELTGDSIAMTSDELKTLEKLDDELSMAFTNDCPFLIKDYSDDGYKGYDYTGKLEVIKEAIESIRHISFIYENEDGSEELVDIILKSDKPVFLIVNYTYMMNSRAFFSLRSIGELFSF